MFGGVALMPAGLCFLGLEPAWALMYLSHPEHAALLVWPGTIIGLALAPALGLKVSHGLLAGRGIGRWGLWMAAVTGLLLFSVLAGMGRLRTVGAYEVFHYGGVGEPLAASRLFWPVLVASLAVPTLFAFSLVQVQRHVLLSENLPPADAEAILADDENDAAPATA